MPPSVRQSRPPLFGCGTTPARTEASENVAVSRVVAGWWLPGKREGHNEISISKSRLYIMLERIFPKKNFTVHVRFTFHIWKKWSVKWESHFTVFEWFECIAAQQQQPATAGPSADSQDCDLRSGKWESWKYIFRSLKFDLRTVNPRVKCEYIFWKNAATSGFVKSTATTGY